MDIGPVKEIWYLYLILSSGEMFSNAHDLTINGGYYYSGQILIQQPPSQGN